MSGTPSGREPGRPGPGEPDDPARFTREWDRFYTSFARSYDLAVRLLPVWGRWIRAALPHVVGPRVLEVSFGTGYLLTALAGRFDACGVDLNRRMTEVARANLRRAGRSAALVRADVARLPFPDAAFDSVVNTMAFSGYPDGRRALAEMARVLRPGGRLVLIDFGWPSDGNPLGRGLTRLMERSGDVIRDVPALLAACGLDAERAVVGGFGSVQLHVAARPD